MPTVEPDSGITRVARTLESSQLLRVLLAGLVVIVLQVPILMIDHQVSVRRATRDQAVTEVTNRWGGEQRIIGPILRIPWRERRSERTGAGERVERVVTRRTTFLPQGLEIVGEARGQVRRRGIFDVSLYQADVELRGTFLAPNFAELDVAAEDVLWDRAELLLGLGDARALRSQPELSWNGASVPLEPGGASLAGSPATLRAHRVDVRADKPLRFRVLLRINGASRLSFAPVGQTTTATLASTWPHPSFEGHWLPAEHAVRGDGFDARWKLSHLGRGYPQRWHDRDVEAGALRQANFGVAFLSPVDPYRMAERSVKYAILFLGLPFLVIWLFDVLAGVRVHPIQYLFVGAALCLFYLLQLALAEHLGFHLAYTLAGGTVATMVTLYGRAILGAGRRAAVLGGLVAALYVFLYVLLREQDYALLLGSIGLLVALAVAMWLTRNVDWYRLESPPAVGPDDRRGDPQVPRRRQGEAL